MQYLLIVLGVILGLALLAMAVLAYLGTKYQQLQAQKFYEEMHEASPYRRRKQEKRRPHNDPLARNKVYEKRRQEERESGVTKYDPHEQALSGSRQQQQGVEIVGLAKPVGFWSKFIMSQKAGFIAARMGMQTKNQKGYWANLLQAQDASRFGQKGRGR